MLQRNVPTLRDEGALEFLAIPEDVEVQSHLTISEINTAVMKIFQDLGVTLVGKGYFDILFLVKSFLKSLCAIDYLKKRRSFLIWNGPPVVSKVFLQEKLLFYNSTHSLLANLNTSM
jgi:hypothetical protein